MNSKWILVAVAGLIGSGVSLAHADERIHAWIKVPNFSLVIGASTPPPPPQAVVVAQPVMVAQPYDAPPVDYHEMLDNFHRRVERLQRMLDKQLHRHIINQMQYDRHATDLDEIVREEQRNAARHDGHLTPREVNDLNRRLTELQDRIHEDFTR